MLRYRCTVHRKFILERNINMYQFISSFTQISIIREELVTVQQSIDYLVRELSKMCDKLPADGCSIEDAYYVCIQERYNKAAERKQKLHEKYIALCNLTHREIDRIEDGTIAMGLRLHGVQQLSWKDTAEQLAHRISRTVAMTI